MKKRNKICSFVKDNEKFEPRAIKSRFDKIHNENLTFMRNVNH